ncbi:hypothetical protein OH687_34395 [Burkholderia anthina]|nr:hypothetical protein OH687_34395 [Burkholderia anthina]
MPRAGSMWSARADVAARAAGRNDSKGLLARLKLVRGFDQCHLGITRQRAAASGRTI